MTPIRWGPFTLDTARRQLKRGDEIIELQPRAFDVLLVLAQRLDQAVSRAELLALAWPGVRVVDDALSQVIRKIRSALGDDANEPVWLLTVPRHGYRLASGPPAGQPSAEPPSAELPPSAPLSEPPAASALYGRTDEIGWFRAVVAGGGRTLTIAATGGYGKTALARVWLAASRGFAISCSHLRTPSELALAIAQRCGVSSDSAASVEILSRALSNAGAEILLLDDADHLDKEALLFASGLTEALPGLVRVHTSRAPLGLAGEVVLPLAGLPPEHAIRMLADRVPPDWADVATLREIAAAVDGSPLALELLAGRAAFMSADELRERLSRPLDLLSRPSEGRHSSVRSCLVLSYNMLPPLAARTFAALSLFEGPFSLQDAERISGATLDVFELLLLQRLIRRERGALLFGHPERMFARERLSERPDREEIGERFRAEILARGKTEDLLALARDLAHPEAAARALLVLFERWQGGIGLLVLEPLARALEAGPEPLAPSARAAIDLVCASFQTGRNLAEARARWQSLAQAADPDLAARGHLGLAGLAAAEQRTEESNHHISQAMALAVRPMTRVRGAILAAHVANREGRPVKALKLLLANDCEAVSADELLGAGPAQKTRAAWLAALASTRRYLGDLAGAESALSEALPLVEPQSRVAAGLRVNLGGLLAGRGALPEAASAFEAAQQAFSKESDLRGESECLYGLSLVRLALGDIALAEATLRTLHQVERALGSEKGTRRASVLRAAAALARGSALEAVAHAELALDPDDPQADTDGRALLAVASARLGQPREVAGEGVWATFARAVLQGAALPEAVSAEALAARRALAGL